MRKIGMMLLAVVIVAGCASSHTTNPQVKKDEQKAEQVVKRCLPSGNLKELFYSKTVRRAFFRCAVPSKNQVAAEHCVLNGVLGHIPTFHRVESVALGCVGRYA